LKKWWQEMGKREMTDAFVAKWRFENDHSKRFKENCKLGLIGRDGGIVPWNIHKIKNVLEMGLDSECQSTEHADRISRVVTKSILDANISFFHIENVKNCIQEELMHQGEYLISGE
jgi:hypothetical protein